MEKAPGISLETLVKYYELECKEQLYKTPISEWDMKILNETRKEMAELKAKSPDFKDFDLNNNEAKNILYNYIDVFVEQLNKIGKNGKTLHADIHPGNIFVNLDVLKNKTGKKLFTLIDTGNTVDITKDQSLRALKLTSYINNGNTKDITDYVLDGAVLPAGLTKEKAAQSIEKELKKIFFDTETQLDSMSNDNLLALTNNIMRKYNVIPNDSQLNLNKAKKSAENSLKQLQYSFFDKKLSNMDVDEGNPISIVAASASMVKTSSDLKNKKKFAVKLQEIKNLLHLSPKEALKQMFNPNMHKTNSPEYLTYKLKQGRNMSEGDFEQWAENFIFGST
jgi:predicted unusual protein kinase regulating ubiquinone biosynthesis (AarF/ABC1/UbiB family)